VGGFNPGYSRPYAPNHSPIASSTVPLHFSSSAPNLPKPIPMAMPSPFSDYPQSLTMQMALLPPDDSRLGSARPHSNPTFPSATKPNSSTSTLERPPYGTQASISTPIKSAKSESSSTVSTPSGKAGQEQCSGVTKAGKRCTRMVKTRAFDPDENDSSSIPRFCHQHSKELLGPSGYYARKTGEWVKFDGAIS
jgi:hypothetical protein